MAADLSSLLPDPTPAIAYSQYPGLKLPDTGGLISLDPVPIQNKTVTGGYFGSSVYNFTSIVPDGGITKAIAQVVVAEMNKIIDFEVRAQALASYLYWVAQGSLGISDIPRLPAQTSGRVYWLITSASASQIVCQYRESEGDADPNSVPYTVIEPFSGGEEPPTSEVNVRLPATGWIKIAGGSLLQNHAGVRYVNAEWDNNPIEDGDSITFTLANPAGNEWLTNLPGDTSDISAAVEFYCGGYREGWTHLKPILPFYGVQTTKNFALSSGYVFTLETSGEVFMAPSADGLRWKAILSGSGKDDIDLSGLALTLLDVSTINGGAVVDATPYADGMAAYEADGYTDMDFTYWKESTSSSALWVGLRTANQWLTDYSGSVGVTGFSEASSVHFYDSNPSDPCRSDGRPLKASQVQTLVINPFKQSVLRQIAYDRPWALVQITPGVPVWTYERWGCPSLSALAGDKNETGDGYHSIIRYQPQGGYGVPLLEDGVYSQQLGSEQLFYDTTDYGPMGDLSSSRKTGYADGTESTVLNKSAIARGGVDFHPYTGAYYHYFGRRQDLGNAYHDLVMPEIDMSLASAKPFPGGYFQAGPVWDPNGVEHPWYIKLSDAFNTYNRLDSTRGIQPKLLGRTIFSYDYDTDTHQLTIDVTNQVVLLASSHPIYPQSELVSAAALGGTTCPLPNGNRFYNWRNPYGTVGAGHYLAQAGDSLVPGSEFPEALQGRKFAIVSAEACVGDTQSYLPPGSKAEYIGVQSKLYNITYSDSDEVFSSVTVTRNSGATTLTGTNVTGGRFSLALAKDTYQFMEMAGDGTTFVVFKFSHLNASALDSERILEITLKTESDTVTYWDVLDLRDGSAAYSTTEGDRGTAVENVFSLSWSKPLTGVSANVQYLDPDTGDWTTTAISFLSGTISNFKDIGSTFTIYANATSSTSATVYVPMQLQGCPILFTIQTSATWSISSSDYYDSYVGYHQGVPTINYNGDTPKVYLCKSDRLVVQDEYVGGGWLLYDYGVSVSGAIEGHSFHIYDGCVAMPPHTAGFAPTIKLNADTLVLDTDYEMHGAEGEIWGIAAADGGTDVVTTDQLTLRIYMGDLVNLPLAKDFIAIRSAFEEMLDHTWLDFWSLDAPEYERFSWTMNSDGAGGWGTGSYSELTPDEGKLNYIYARMWFLSTSEPWAFFHGVDMQLWMPTIRSKQLDRSGADPADVSVAHGNITVSGLSVTEEVDFFGWEDEMPAGASIIVSEYSPSEDKNWVAAIVSTVTEDPTGEFSICFAGRLIDTGEMVTRILDVTATASELTSGTPAAATLTEMVKTYLEWKNDVYGFRMFLMPTSTVDIATGGTEEKLRDVAFAFSTDGTSFQATDTGTDYLPFGTVTWRRVEWTGISVSGCFFAHDGSSLDFVLSHALQHREILA